MRILVEQPAFLSFPPPVEILIIELAFFSGRCNHALSTDNRKQNALSTRLYELHVKRLLDARQILSGARVDANDVANLHE